MVKFGGKIGTSYQMLKNAFKKHPLQNRTNVQIKGGGGHRPFEQCSKKLHFFESKASLIVDARSLSQIHHLKRQTWDTLYTSQGLPSEQERKWLPRKRFEAGTNILVGPATKVSK